MNVFKTIFVQKWPSKPFVTLRDSSEGTDEENREVGTHVMDDYPTYEAWIKMFDMDTDTPDMAKLEAAHNHKLPVWIKGNVYFNGAKAYKNETCHRIDNEHTVTVDVDCSDGNPVLSTNLYDYLDDFSVGMVNSDILGYAFEPEERFENPDGTDIVFDRDYFGSHRGVNILPGPFASKEDAGKKLF